MGDSFDRYTALTWDVIVIGTGMGGATLGHALARRGLRVLFVEKGKDHSRNPHAITGEFAEQHLATTKDHRERREILANSGRWWDDISDRSGRRPRTFIPWAGAGVGGSTSLYGMVMQRFGADDFFPAANFPGAEGADLPESWPVSYQELRPHYRAMEELYEVRGQLDPLRSDELDPLPARPRIPPGSVAEELSTFFSAKGLHPHQPGLACRLVEGCLHCQSFICPKDCKLDSWSVSLRPAVERHGAELLTECRVTELVERRGVVVGVVCERNGAPLHLKGSIVALAAGALETPCILFRSLAANGARGLGNGSDLVGRNLTRNFYDLYLVFPDNRNGLRDGTKDIFFSDFYTRSAGKLGVVHSFGNLMPVASAVLEVREQIKNALGPAGSLLATATAPLVRRFVGRQFSSGYMLVSTMEDMPYRENRVVGCAEGTGAIEVVYRLRDHDRQRILELRRRMKELLSPYRYTLFRQAEKNKNFIAIAAGTCRFGDDPRRSVLDRFNRVHDVANLYVVDASFFPSNPAFNSALTIGANALRVADHILEG